MQLNNHLISTKDQDGILHIHGILITTWYALFAFLEHILMVSCMGSSGFLPRKKWTKFCLSGEGSV